MVSRCHLAVAASCQPENPNCCTWAVSAIVQTANAAVAPMIKEKKRRRSAVRRYAVLNVIFLHRDKFARLLARSILPSVFDDTMIGQDGPDGSQTERISRNSFVIATGLDFMSRQGSLELTKASGSLSGKRPPALTSPEAARQIGVIVTNDVNYIRTGSPRRNYDSKATNFSGGRRFITRRAHGQEAGWEKDRDPGRRRV
jgi:hypothetical protein